MAERMTNRKRQAVEMRKRIQAVALDLFNKRGFEHVSIEEIAQEANCSVGNIYHYFQNKEALAGSVPAYVDELYQQLKDGYDESQTMTGRQKLLDFVGQTLLISSADALVWQSFVYSLKSPELGVLKIKADRVYFQVLEHLVRECQAEGSIPADMDVDTMVQDLVILHRGTLIQWRICEGSFDIRNQGVRMAETLLDGLKL